MMGLSVGPASGVSYPPLDNVLSMEPAGFLSHGISRWATPACESEYHDPEPLSWLQGA
jgi:hypothetical protein